MWASKLLITWTIFWQYLRKAPISTSTNTNYFFTICVISWVYQSTLKKMLADLGQSFWISNWTRSGWKFVSLRTSFSRPKNEWLVYSTKELSQDKTYGLCYFFYPWLVELFSRVGLFSNVCSRLWHIRNSFTPLTLI